MAASDWVAHLVVFGGGAFVLWIIWALIEQGRGQMRNLAILKSGGFQIDHRIGGGTIAVFDDSRREMAIICGSTLHRYSYSQIDTWSHEYRDRNGSQIRNKFVITVLDTKYPRHEIRVSAKEGQLWLAKMRAILAK